MLNSIACNNVSVSFKWRTFTINSMADPVFAAAGIFVVGDWNFAHCNQGVQKGAEMEKELPEIM